MDEPIVIVDHDPRWVEAFQTERATILRALGEQALAIEHYGSTAVPGLAAKPIVDVMVALRDLDAAEEEVTALESAGYERRSTGDLDHPRRLFLVRYEGGRRAAHIALVEPEGRYWREHIAFRDALRVDVDLAARYAELKRRLAARHGADRLAYTDGKTEFVAEALRSLASPE
jgi:GrpB-like predicted nucleotidyltransferase (UPF0157 family)